MFDQIINPTTFMIDLKKKKNDLASFFYFFFI